jgi:ApbE superfamily uncharacterized protein (UPF0280 family)
MSGSRRKKSKKRPAPASYRQRTYRHVVQAAGLVASFITVRETDLHILAPTQVEAQAYDAVYRYRNQLENYLARRPEFLTSLVPLPSDPLAPPIIRAMLAAARAAGVGPMAAVAGTIAEFVGKELLAAGTTEIIIENGGDIFLHRNKDCLVSIFAGQSPLSQRVGIRIPFAHMPLGVCTSSGAVGHSLSLGKADSVTVLARSTPLADAVATRLGNEVSAQGDIDRALRTAQSFPDILGVVIILADRLGAWGAVDLVKID